MTSYQPQEITYKAIPVPVPEPWRTRLVEASKAHNQKEIVKIEAELREQFGVDVTRKEHAINGSVSNVNYD